MKMLMSTDANANENENISCVLVTRKGAVAALTSEKPRNSLFYMCAADN